MKRNDSFRFARARRGNAKVNDGFWEKEVKERYILRERNLETLKHWFGGLHKL